MRDRVGMHHAARHVDLRTLRAATVTGDGTSSRCRPVAGTLTWPWEHAHRVLHVWRASGSRRRDGRVSAPRGSCGRRAARPAVAIESRSPVRSGWCAGPRSRRCARLEPAIDTVAAPARRPRCGRRPPRVRGRMTPVTAHRPAGALPAAAVDAFAAAAGPGSRAELLSAELHHLGGAYALAALGAAPDPDDAERARIAIARARAPARALGHASTSYASAGR